MIEPSSPPVDADLFIPSAERLATMFYNELGELGRFEPLVAEKLPPAYRSLLAHHDHMTVALEAFHNSLVMVRVLNEWQDEASYARCSLLSRQSDNAIVQFGIMRIWLGDLPAAARQEIIGKKLPLGRVLIRHNVLREVELITFWRIEPGPVLRQHMPLSGDTPLYGRSAQILVDQRPTVQLLEIVTLPT